MERFTSTISRAAVQGNTLVGLAAVYGEPTTRQRDFAGTETIARGAFDGVLGGDVVAVVNHDMTQLLGRTSSGTLRLSSRDDGLWMELDLPDTQLGHDTRTLVARGDLAGMSFTAALGEIERVKGGVVHRTFSRLVDVSVVTSPAYAGTSVAVRNAHPNVVREQLIRARARVRTGRVGNDRG
jgi:HK97 family phage prohead protease